MEPDSLPNLSRGPVVVVWDQTGTALPTVMASIVDCQAIPFRVQRKSEFDALRYSAHSSTAVVALGTAGPERDFNLGVVRILKDTGFTIITHDDGADGWPLAVRCGPLVAGACALLDSATDGFSSKLRGLLMQSLREGLQKTEEETRLKNAMRDLGLVGESPAMVAVFRRVARLSALSDLPTLITGETGTGKELLAHALYQLDPGRRSGPFVAVNCSAISPTLAESELFGHRRGAFTGADRDRKGWIRAAHGGVLFLDEIAELSAVVQTKLLRVLQESRVLAVGEDQETPISVRIIAATNSDLRGMLGQGKFRADLFHRLNVLSIEVPPLRERRADIPALVEHFVRKHRGVNPAAASTTRPEFVEALTSLDLPGNARELENLVRWAVVHNDGSSPLGLPDLQPEVWAALTDRTEPVGASEAPIAAEERPPRCTAAHESARSPASKGWNLSRSMQAREREVVEAALRETQGNRSEAARLLSISPRCLYNKIRRHHLL